MVLSLKILLLILVGLNCSRDTLYAQDDKAVAKSPLEKYGKHNPLPPRWGYEVSKDWDSLLAIVLEKKYAERAQAMNLLWGAKIGAGQETATYVLDLLKIFKHDPAWFVKNGLSFFNNNESCLYYWLIPETQYIEYEEFLELAKRAEKESAKDKAIKSFVKNSKSYFEAVKAKKGIPELKKCNLDVLKSVTR